MSEIQSLYLTIRCEVNERTKRKYGKHVSEALEGKAEIPQLFS